MATETQKQVSSAETQPRHSALAEFGRDERRPAVLLLSALLIAVLFFGMGLLFGRWTASPDSSKKGTVANAPAAQPSPSSSPQSNSTNTSIDAAGTQRRFTVLIATYDTLDKSKALLKTLEDAGFKDIRTTSPRPGEAAPRYSVIAGRYTEDEARDAVRRMRSANDPRLKNAKVIDASGN